MLLKFGMGIEILSIADLVLKILSKRLSCALCLP